MAITQDTKKADSARQTADGRNVKSGRRLAGINVTVAVIVATAVLIIANIIAFKHGLRSNVGTLGRNRLSARTKRILDHADQTDQKVALTSIYAADTEEHSRDRFLPRVRDLLEEMGRHSDAVTAVNVASDSQKSEVLNRLRDRLDAKANAHRNAIADFRDLSRTQLGRYKNLQATWEAYPPDGWLTQFGVAKAFVSILKNSQEDLNRTDNEVRAGLSASGLPNYPAMVSKIDAAAKDIRSRLASIAEHMDRLRDVPAKSDEAKAKLLQAVAAMAKATAKVVTVAGKADAPPQKTPKDPSAVLEELAKASVLAGDAARAAAKALDDFNSACAGYAQFATSWRAGGVPLTQRTGGLAMACEDLAVQARSVRAAAKVEVQGQFITQIRPELPKLTAQAERTVGAAADLVRELATMDPATKAIFDRVGDDGYLAVEIKRIADLLAKTGEVPDLSDESELFEQISQDNIILVEVGGKVGVVGFNDVWPLAESRFSMGAPDEKDDRRNFNGDTAISSKIFSLAAEPLGEVVLAYFERIPPPQMRRFMPPVAGPIPSIYLDTLKERLKKANLTVTTWNLADDDAPPAPSEGMPRTLLILPPPPPPMPPMGRQQQQPPPQWTAVHTSRLTRVIDEGTPAIFLATHMPPEMSMFGPAMPSPYLLNDYLRGAWGVEARTDLRLVQAEPDPNHPGKFELPVLRWTFLPMSTFTDHPVGKPLQARPMYWLSACPVGAVADEDDDRGITVRDILSVPEGMKGTWAAANATQLEMKLFRGRGNDLGCGDDPGDLAPPFALALEASKKVGDEERRIIVLGVGLSFIEPYLTQRIPRLTSGEALATDPPPINDVELVINSAYHLLGQPKFIAAGPSVMPRIQHLTRGEEWAIKGAIGLGWPLLVMAAGVVVGIVRKR